MHSIKGVEKIYILKMKAFAGFLGFGSEEEVELERKSKRCRNRDMERAAGVLGIEDQIEM